jgi:hypothetical protein
MQLFSEKGDTVSLEHNSIANSSRTIDEEKSKSKLGQSQSKGRTWHQLAHGVS